MSGRLRGNVALVTGGSRGIGRRIALALAREGADVVVNFNQAEAAAAKAVREIESVGRRAIAARANVADLAAVRAMVERAVRELGRLDILVNNAGTSSYRREVADATPDEWEAVFAVNFYGVLYPSQAAVPIMRGQKRGCIINISSTMAERFPAIGAPYTCSKAAVEALTRVMAKEEARRGIRVNCVRPGLVRTDMGIDYMKEEKVQKMAESLALGRVGEPEDIAHMVTFLVGDEASWITGQVFTVNGGGPLS